MMYSPKKLVSALLTTTALAACGAPIADTTADSSDGVRSRPSSALLWRGFEQSWDYNHRVRRMGDWITQGCDDAGCVGTVHHAASAGLGRDEWSFQSHYTELTTGDARFQPGGFTHSIRGVEGVSKTETFTVRKSMNGDMAGLTRYVALMNGFDLAVGDAEVKKLERLKILIGDVRVDGGDFVFDVTVGFEADCDSAECRSGGSTNQVRYGLEVKFLIVGGSAGRFRYENADDADSYYWLLGSELSLVDQRRALTLGGGEIHPQYDGFRAGTVGIRGFAINLNDDHHMIQTAIRAVNIDYDASGEGTVSFDADVFFKNWAAGMEDTHRPWGSGWSYPSTGTATNMELFYTLLQFTQGTISQQMVAGGESHTTAGKRRASGGGF